MRVRIPECAFDDAALGVASQPLFPFGAALRTSRNDPRPMMTTVNAVDPQTAQVIADDA